jgi:hypothetical protein
VETGTLSRVRLVAGPSCSCRGAIYGSDGVIGVHRPEGVSIEVIDRADRRLDNDLGLERQATGLWRSAEWRIACGKAA